LDANRAVSGQQAAADGRRCAAAPAAELAGDEPKMASRPPFRTGKIPKERGAYKELTGGFGREVEESTEEINAAQRSCACGEGRRSGARGAGEGAALL
jgi:hypothetical protein